MWHSMPKRWHINATLHLFLAPIEIGGKIFSGRSGPLPLAGYAARGLSLYCLSQ